MPRSLTVASFNILHGLSIQSSGRLDLAAVAESIAALDADIVALQEVDRGLPRSGGVDQVGWLAEELGMDGRFAPALLGDPERAWDVPAVGDPGGPAYGVGLLSRIPITGTRHLRLPGGGAGRRARPASPSRPGWDREPRTALTAVVATDGGPLPVTTTHLSYLPWRGLRQLRAAARDAGGARRCVLLGDLNLPPRTVRRALRDWDHHEPPATYPAWEPRLALDQILTRGLGVSGVRVAGATTSDHLPLLAEISIEGDRRPPA